jgi:hypothetical protein
MQKLVRKLVLMILPVLENTIGVFGWQPNTPYLSNTIQICSAPGSFIQRVVLEIYNGTLAVTASCGHTTSTNTKCHKPRLSFKNSFENYNILVDSK